MRDIDIENAQNCEVTYSDDISAMEEEGRNSSEEEQDALVVRRKRIQLLPDSDSETENEHVSPKSPEQKTSGGSDNDSNGTNILKTVSHQPSKSPTSSSSDETCKNKELSRIKSKRKTLTQKFKSLVKSRVRDTVPDDSEVNSPRSEIMDLPNESSEQSETEDGSIERIKQKINERTNHLKSTIYDPDTSDEERTPAKETKKSIKPRKSTKFISPKPARMSAKQAMENMKKIKSESNRMLREKEVSLPYHRPKALALKDIMRRRPAVAADGKALSIKMNEEQLKQFALALEQRQKEVLELCKSDTEEEDNLNNETTEETQTKNDTSYDSLLNSTRTDEIDGLAKKNEKVVNENLLIDNINDLKTKDDIAAHVPLEKEILDVSDANTKDGNPNETVMEESKEYLPDNESKNCVSEDTEEVATNADHNADKNFAEDGNASAEMSLVYHSADDTVNDEAETTKDLQKNTELNEVNHLIGTEESQLISLHYDTEKMDSEGFDQSKEKDRNNTVNMELDDKDEFSDHEEIKDRNNTETMELNDKNEFSDNEEMNMEDIDNLIENAEILSQTTMGDVNSPMLVRDSNPMNIKPKLMGAPGMVIDLDGTDPCIPKKLTGVELLKERFTFFAKLKTPEEIERQKDKRVKPGVQHIKLKQELEDQIAEQRSIEWSKRLEEEKQNQKDLDAMRGELSENDLDSIEAKLEEKEIGEDMGEESSSDEEEEEEEEDIEIKDKPRKRNPMVADEAEDSDCDDGGENTEITKHSEAVEDVDGDVEDNDEIGYGEEESESEESSEEEIDDTKPKKGRILKAFEDSDDESPAYETETVSVKSQNQDDEIQLAQRQKSYSDDLFTSQESTPLCNNVIVTETINNSEERDLGTQTFSILNSATTFKCPVADNLDAIDNSETLVEGNLNNIIVNHLTDTQNSQELGEDLLALCTGKFYDNQFVSQLDEENLTSQNQIPLENDGFYTDKDSQESGYSLVVNEKKHSYKNETAIEKQKNQTPNDESNGIQNPDKPSGKPAEEMNMNRQKDIEKQTQETRILNSILDELNEPEPPKVNTFFTGNTHGTDISNTQHKKKFVIDSDDEENAESKAKKKKLKKKKVGQRALQISDDEEDDEVDKEIEEDCISEPEDEGERLVEYDSEENEVEIRQPKKSKKLGDFFEQEAELTSEDEWVGSGDEDERGLDRLEREAGDDDTFNQHRLQRELGQIHMREVLDQDKREVRLIQELLFEDGDLGDGHRQRKFRWNNADTEEGETPLDLLDSQEEEFESEEQWRKQRHEREMFLKQLNDKEQLENTTHIAFNRTSMIKAGLSKSSTNVIVDVSSSQTEVIVPKKTAKDIPSPKKPFTLLQQNYHNSLLTRGRGALARLAALATPLAEDDDGPKVGSIAPSSKRNFVFAAITPNEKETKVTKRKAEVNVGTPRLVKKMRAEEKTNRPKSSLLDLI